MNETAPTLAPGAGGAKRKRASAAISKASLSKSEKSSGRAKKSPYDGALAAREITASFVETILTGCATARGTLGGALDKKTDKTGATQTENLNLSQLYIVIQSFQASARQKHAFSAPETLKDYLIGQNITQSRASLEQAAATILKKLETVTLPGVTPAKIAQLQQLAAAYKDADLNQGGQQAAATGTRLIGEALITDIAQRRMTVQFAADAEWPWTTPANTAIRPLFDLPAHKPFTPKA